MIGWHLSQIRHQTKINEQGFKLVFFFPGDYEYCLIFLKKSELEGRKPRALVTRTQAGKKCY